MEEKGIVVKVNAENDCRKVLNVEVHHSVIEEEKEKVLSSMVKKVAMPGFRKGKVPKAMVRSHFAGEIENEALKAVLPAAYSHALETEKLSPIGEPVFRDIDSGGDGRLTFRVDIETVPEIGLADYKGIKVKDEKAEVTDEDIENVLKSLQEREADYEKVDRPSVSSDIVVIDYAPVGKDGKRDEAKEVKEYPVEIGRGQLFPEFEKELAGAEAGKTGKVELTYPEDFKQDNLAGKKMSYEYLVREVKERKLPPLDDAFAVRLDEKFKTIGELRDDIRRRLVEEKEREAERKREEAAIDVIIGNNPFDVPRSMIERYKKELEKEDEQRRRMMGVGPLEDEGRKKELDALYDRIARRNIKRYFLIDHIAAVEKIEVSQEEIEGEIERMAKEGGRDVEDVRKVIPKGSENYGNLRNRMREKKVLDLILDRTGGE